MYTFWHHSSCALSRQVKSILDHLDLEYNLLEVEYWKADNPLSEITPFGAVPVLKVEGIGVIDSIYSIVEYLIFAYPTLHLFPKGIVLLNETRRLLFLINQKFYSCVLTKVIQEKFLRLVMGSGSPRRESLRSAALLQAQYFDYITVLLKEKGFLVYEKVSIVDIAFAAHISLLDYFGMISWYKYPILRSWYRVIKSLPNFKTLLKDRIMGFVPPEHYSEPDF